MNPISQRAFFEAHNNGGFCFYGGEIPTKMMTLDPSNGCFVTSFSTKKLCLVGSNFFKLTIRLKIVRKIKKKCQNLCERFGLKVSSGFGNI